MFKRPIILIGMPGSGKSTIGKALAASCNMDFIDTDDVLTKELGMSLQVYIDQHGKDDFAAREEEFLTGFEVTGSPCIVSTGGSAVLYPKAMVCSSCAVGVRLVSVPLGGIKCSKYKAELTNSNPSF